VIGIPNGGIEFVGISKERLRDAALALEEQLSVDAPSSLDIAAFAKYPPLVNAILRAKAMQIEQPEEIPGMRYWLFETDLAGPQKYRKLGELEARFSLLLKGWNVTK